MGSGHWHFLARFIQTGEITEPSAVSQETKRDLLRLFNIDPERIRIIYNGIDPEEYYPRSSREHLANNGINPDQPFILFVGRFARQKGIIHLVNANQYTKT